MGKKCTRRQFIKTTGGSLVAVGVLGGLGGVERAFAKDTIVAVEWGGPNAATNQKLLEKQNAIDVNWVYHSGGAAAILAKIRAIWPRVRYDVVAVWSPVFLTMIREGWAQTITVKDVPNLADIPDALLFKDDKGNCQGIPRILTGIHWGYREDTCPIAIKHIEDLLDPRLKGQISFPDPVLNLNLQMISLAKGRGGDVYNMEPGWEFIKELVKSGNIGRIAHTDTENASSITTGECSVMFGASTSHSRVAKHFPYKYLTKVKDPGLKTALIMEGWTVLKGGNTKGAFEFLNFLLRADNQEEFGMATGAVPTNKKAKVSTKLSHMQFTEEELAAHAYNPDFEYISKQADGWLKRWEKEVVPML